VNETKIPYPLETPQTCEVFEKCILLLTSRMEQYRQELETVPITQTHRVIELTQLLTILARNLAELKHNQYYFNKK